MKENEILLTEEQVSEHIQVSPQVIREWREVRGLPHLRITNKVVRYRLSDVEAWLDKKRVQK